MRRHPERSRARLLTGLIAFALLAAPGPAIAAGADTKSKISVAEKRLAWLAEQVGAKRARVSAIHESIRGLAAQIREGNLELDALDRRHRRHEDQLIETMASHDTLRRQMDDVSREAYMRGPASYVGVMMQADSFEDADSAALFTSLVLGRNRDVAARTAYAAKQIAALKAQDEAMIERRANLLRTLRNQQDAMLSEFAESQKELESVSQIREEVSQLLSTLQRQLRAEEEAALGGSMPYGKWAAAFLESIGASPTARGNLVALVAWQLAEGTSARWNPLATTWRMPGSTNFNGHRVQNYVSLQQGLEATRKTLSRPGHKYEAILSSLRGSGEAMTTARAINASNWCRGCAGGEYVVELIPTVERYYDRYAS